MAQQVGRSNGAPFAEPLLQRASTDAVTSASTTSLDSVGSDPSPNRHRHRKHSPVLAPATHDDSLLGPLQQPYIGLASVIAIEFFNVSGGPWGSEDVFSYGGPLVGTAAIIGFAVCFSLPQCSALSSQHFQSCITQVPERTAFPSVEAWGGGEKIEKSTISGQFC
eukprot:3496324-Amphidinium_carterae.1